MASSKSDFPSRHPSRSTALVTGASSGIGRELARVLAAQGHDLILTARHDGPLRELAAEVQSRHGITARVLPEDLATTGGPGRLHARLADDGLAVDVLVNNAGFGEYGPFAASDPERDAAMLQLNVQALTLLTRLLLPGMLARGQGRILNVASTAAFFPGPLMAVYYASKAYVLSLSEALAAEVSGTGVTVTCLCPGPTRTGFQEEAHMEGVRLVRRPLMDAARVARAGYAGMRRGRTIVVPGMLNRLMILAPRFLPRRMAAALVRWAQAPAGAGA